MLGEYFVRVSQGSRGGQGHGQRTSQCLHNVPDIVPQADTNRHIGASGLSALTSINDIAKGSAVKESDERDERRRFSHVCKNR